MEMEMDRLSALPEALLFEILDRMGMKEAAKTAVLSKEWRFLWTNVPFPFRDDGFNIVEDFGVPRNIEKIETFVTRVHAALALRRGPALRTLSFSFGFDERFTSDMDSWLDFAASSKVENLYLDLVRIFRDIRALRHRYTLPQMVYSIASLRELQLQGCILSIIQPETTVEWRCLKSLSLSLVYIPQQVIDGITSGCHVLETLYLKECSGFNRLEIGSLSFRFLRLRCTGDNERGWLEISATYMRSLDVTISGRKVRLQNVPSLENATVDVHEVQARVWRPVHVKVINNTIELLQDLAHVKTLQLSKRCIKVAGLMATNGRRLPQLRVKDLHIGFERDAGIINGVVALVESSPYVEKLLLHGYRACYIKGNAFFKWVHEEEASISWGPITRDDLNCDLLHLKTLSLVGIVGLKRFGEPALTLAQILLKRAPILEKMTINRRSSEVKTDFINKALLNRPKSSTKVSIRRRLGTAQSSKIFNESIYPSWS